MTRLTWFFGFVFLLLPGAVRAEWHEASSTHFRVYAEGSAGSARELARKLERFDKGMRVLNRIPDENLGPANRLTVYVVSSIGAVQRLSGNSSTNVAGFYVGRAGESVAFTPRRAGASMVEVETILLHEYAHHFLAQNIPGVLPAWFVEGFAEFNSTARFDKDGSVGFGLPAVHRGIGLLTLPTLPIEALLASAERKFSDDQTEAFYGRGWLLTHFLTFDEARKGQLNAYLAALNRGVSSLDAARATFGDLRQLDRELKSYLQRSRFSYVRLALERLPLGPISIRQLSPGEAAIMPLRMRSDRGVNAEQAKTLIREMRPAAAPYTNDPRVQAALAEAEYDAGNLAESEAAADRALAVQPTNMDALTYRARVAMDRASADPSANAAVWNQVRRRLIAANAVEPDDPEPLIFFYSSFREQGIEPTRNAVAGLLQALELAPQDGRLRLMVARQHLVDGKAPEARGALAPLAFSPHGGKMGKALQGIIATLDESGPQAALAAWESASLAPDETYEIRRD